MLRCQQCNCVYQDNALKFCTNDGVRLSPGNQVAENSLPGSSNLAAAARRTPEGELMLETLVSPSDDWFGESILPSARKTVPSFQSFGLHSANAFDSPRQPKAVDGFRSFDSLIAEGQEGILNESGNTPVNSRAKAPQSSNSSVAGSSKNNKLNSTFIIICLTSALLFLTGLAFAATYFF